MSYPNSATTEAGLPDLNYKSNLARNLSSRILTLTTGLFAIVSVFPLILVLTYVLLKGGSRLSLRLFLETPPPPGLDGGGIGRDQRDSTSSSSSSTGS